MNPSSKSLSILLLFIGIGAGIAAGAGVFLRGEPITRPFTSPRGEVYEYRDSGVYRFTAERVVAEGVGWDMVTLGLAVPFFFLTWGRVQILERRRATDIRIRFLLVGILCYFFYQYLEYAMYWALGPLFLLHVFLFSASAIGIIALLRDIKVEQLPEAFHASFPLKGIAILSGFVGIVLLLMWIPFVLEALQGKIEGKLYGSTTLVVQALDLGFIVPLAFWTAFSTWKKRAVGYLLSFVVIIKGVLMGAALCAMLVNVWISTAKLEAVPLMLFGAIMLVSAYLLWRIFRSYPANQE
ncbi:MAG: hypothetical protein N2442_12235 [Spirochaetes bacterium]|nr:hypothetical protein [Spirochaetota bacterium]